MISSSQILCLTLASCHCSWLKTLSLRSIQTVQSVIPCSKCQILIFFTKFLGNSFIEQCLLPIKIVIITSSYPIELMHDKCGPSPSPPSLNVVLDLVFDWFTYVREAKGAWFGNRDRCNACPSFVNYHCLMPNGRPNGNFLARPKRVPYLRLVGHVVSRKVALPFLCRTENSLVLVDDRVSTKLNAFCHPTLALIMAPLAFLVFLSSKALFVLINLSLFVHIIDIIV